MKYQAQIQTFTVVVENAPPVVWEAGAQVYVDIPKNFNVQKVSIWHVEDVTGNITMTYAGVNTSGNKHVNTYVLIQNQQNYPYIMEAVPGTKIEQGFYLAALSSNAGDGCIFQVLFEGYIE